MKKKNLALALVVSAFCLVSCGETPAESSEGNEYPQTNQELVEKACSIAAICTYSSTGGVLTAGQNNIAPVGSGLIVAKSYSVKTVIDGTTYNLPVNFSWSLSNSSGWTIKDAKNDSTHQKLLPSIPAAGQADLNVVLTGTASYADATATVSYNVTIPAAAAADFEYNDIGKLATDFFENKTVETGSQVVISGFVTGYNSDLSSVYIQSGTGGCQLYNASSFDDFYDVGSCIKVQGELTNYYGLEMKNVSSVTFTDSSSVAALTVNEITEENVKAITGNGKYDNALWEGDAVYSGYNNGTPKFTVGSVSVYMYFKSSIEKETKNAYKAMFTSSTPTGTTYHIKGVLSYYSSVGFELIPWMAGWITAK